MRTWRPEPVNGICRSVTYEPCRGRLYVVIGLASVEIPIGEMAAKCGLSGATLDAASARWRAVNAPAPELRKRSEAARERERTRQRERKRKAAAKARTVPDPENEGACCGGTAPEVDA